MRSAADLMPGPNHGPGVAERLSRLPDRHRTFLEGALAAAPGVDGIVGLAAGHYLADKIERGEILEALDGLGVLRTLVLAPLAFRRAGAPATGVRRIESRVPAFATALGRTVGGVDAAACATALAAAIELYTELREAGGQGSEVEMSEVERDVRAHVAGLPARLGRPGRGS
ncbi:hypothetical protein [Candidatus Palauibacter sp.]|uniref:hypothetical protein n=1 Tax=Candidatus Palauibacter sp. TaxID=3101350 RepID=UPI003C704BAC